MILAWLRRKQGTAVRPGETPSRRAVRDRLGSGRAAALLSDALERFPEFDADQARILVRDVVEDFFFAVMDLEASESYHHASPWGLAEHSLEVAVTALRVARSRHFVGHAAPNPEEEAHRLPRLRYACFLLGLYHDLGKVLQAEIRGPNRETHNPFVEPLGAFYDRHGREACRLKWRSGRSLDDHVRLTPYLVGHLLPRPAAGYLGPSVLAEVLEEKTSGAGELREIIDEADQQSVRDERRGAEARAASAGTGHAAGSFLAYLAGSFAEGRKQGRLAVNVFGGDVLLGRRFAFFTYPEAILKLVSLVKDGFGRADIAARKLGDDEGAARFFLAKLKADEGLYIDPATGLWKLKATIEHDGASDVREGVLIPLAHLGLSPEATESFPGTITFSRPTDASEVVIDDFRPAPAGKVEKPAPSAPPPAKPTPPPPPPHRSPPVETLPPPGARTELFPSRVVPATIGPQPAIDPEGLARDLVEGIVAGWIPTNVQQAQVYVSPKTTFVATPAVFLKMREQGLYPAFDPQDRRSAYLKALARLECVRKSRENRIVYPILLGPESERPLKVIKFDTLGLFTSEELRKQVGVWKDWERIIELPQGWKPGDAVVPGEDSDD